MTSRVIRALDAVSQLGNVLIFNGDPNYSISSECYRRGRHRWRRFVDALFSPFESDHCRKSYENDVTKAQALLIDDLERQERIHFQTSAAQTAEGNNND